MVGRAPGTGFLPRIGVRVTFLRRNDGMGLVAVYFHSNPSCRLPPTPPNMKMAVGEIGRGLFSHQSQQEENSCVSHQL